MDINLEAFYRNREAVAALVSAQDLFSLLRRSVVLPPNCAALTWIDGAGVKLVHTGGTLQDEDGLREVMVVRCAPFELRYELSDLPSRDGYPFSASLVLDVSVVPERSELTAFRRTVMGSQNRVDTTRLRRFAEEVVRVSVADFIRERPAAELVLPATWNAFDAVLAERFKPVGFASGLALGEDPRLTLDSPAFLDARRTEEAQVQRQRRIEAEQRARDASLAAKKAHLSELEGLVDRVRQLAEKDRGVGVTELIRTFDPARRGELYHGLLVAAGSRRVTEAVLIVAGDELIWLDPGSPGRTPRKLVLESPVGGLRSVRAQTVDGRRVILVGAGRGVHWIEDGELRRTYTWTPATPLRGGFNSAVIADGRVWATHSEVGIVAWPIDRPDDPALVFTQLTASARAVRDLQLDDEGRMWCAIDHRVIAWSPDRIVPVPAGASPRAITAAKRSDQPSRSSAGASLPSPPPPVQGEVLLSMDERISHQRPGIPLATGSPDLDLGGPRGGAASGEQSAVDLPAAEFIAPDMVASLAAADGRVFAGLRDGRVVAWPAADPAEMTVLRPGGADSVEGLAWLAGGGAPRLLVADGSPLLTLLVLGDAYRGEYRAHHTLRWAFAAEDLIVAVNANRDQVFLWKYETPEEPFASVSVGRMTGRSIQDVALVITGDPSEPGDPAS